MKRKVCDTLVLIIVMLSLNLSILSTGENNQPFMTLVVDTAGGGIRPDYGLFVAQHLREIGIDVEVKVQEWSVFIGELNSADYDIKFGNLRFQNNDPAPIQIFSKNGYLLSGSPMAQVPYVNESEDLIKTGLYITDFELRKSIYDIWQQIFMDKILPIFPLFSRHKYEIVWENTLGYDSDYGLIDSLPYMSYNGLHWGQKSGDTFSFGDNNWSGLNPLFWDDKASRFVIQLMSEPLIKSNIGGFPDTTGLIDYWEQIDDYNYKFKIRDGVFWNPSYNITERNSNSLDLQNAPLMVGLKDLSSNGTNQQVTAKDAVFTLLCWASELISDDPELYEWIKRIWIDSVDNSVFYIEVDGDPETLKKEPFVQIFSRLEIDCLPEFFLNSTSNEKSYTLGGVECTGLYYDIGDSPEWESFANSAFYYGKYMLNYFDRNDITVLKRNDRWYGVGAKDGQSELRPFVENFEIKYVWNAFEAFEEFKQGTLDICDITPFPEKRREIEEMSYIIHKGQLNSFDCMFFNLERPFIGGEENNIWLSDIGREDYTLACAVRKAICYAINRDEINQELYDNEYRIINNPLPPLLSNWYNEEIIKYDFNLEKAWDWMNAAGFYAPPPLNTIFSYSYKSTIYISVTGLLACLEFIYYKRRDLKYYRLFSRKSLFDDSISFGSGMNQITLNSELKKDDKSDFLLNSYLR